MRVVKIGRSLDQLGGSGENGLARIDRHASTLDSTRAQRRPIDDWAPHRYRLPRRWILTGG